jgi:hypothetical protein
MSEPTDEDPLMSEVAQDDAGQSSPSDPLHRRLARSGLRPDGSLRFYLGGTRRALLVVMAVVLVSTLLNLIALPRTQSSLMWFVVGFDVLVLAALGRSAALWPTFANISNDAVTLQRRWPPRSINLERVTTMQYSEWEHEYGYAATARSAVKSRSVTEYRVDINEPGRVTRFCFRHLGEAVVLAAAISTRRSDLSLVGMPELDDAGPTPTVESAVVRLPAAAGASSTGDASDDAGSTSNRHSTVPIARAATSSLGDKHFTLASIGPSSSGRWAVIIAIVSTVFVIVGTLGPYALMVDRRPVDAVVEPGALLQDIRRSASLLGDRRAPDADVTVKVEECSPRDSWLRASPSAATISVSMYRLVPKDIDRVDRWRTAVLRNLGFDETFVANIGSFSINMPTFSEQFAVYVTTNCVVANKDQRRQIVAAATDLAERMIAADYA